MHPRDAMEIAGAKVQVLVSSHETTGRHSICRIETAGPVSVPSHAHRYEDVCFFVESGEFQFELAGSPVVAPPGSVVFIPRGAAYRFRAPSQDTGRLLLLAFPGGVDLLLHDLCATQGKPVGPILEKHGITLLSSGLSPGPSGRTTFVRE